MLRSVVIMGLTLPWLAGCGDSGPTISPVSGMVLIDGEPLKLGSVRVMPQGYRPAHGKIVDGNFELTTYEAGDGCVHGSHPVTITALELLPGQSQKWHAPKQYSDPRSSALQISIDGPADDVQLELTWGGGQPFIETFAGNE